VTTYETLPKPTVMDSGLPFAPEVDAGHSITLTLRTSGIACELLNRSTYGRHHNTPCPCGWEEGGMVATGTTHIYVMTKTVAAEHVLLEVRVRFHDEEGGTC
jgi:hypothetical protein